MLLSNTQAPKHYEILIANTHHLVREQEIEKIRDYFLKEKYKAIDTATVFKQSTQTNSLISIPIK